MHQTATQREPITAIPNALSHVIGDPPDLLCQILDPAVNLCLWRRPVQPEVSRELLPLQASHLPDVRCPTSPASFDHTYLRLLCTYRGPGTEWLSDAQVDRAAQRGGAPNEDIILETAVERPPGKGCVEATVCDWSVPRGSWQGMTRRNSRSIATSYNAARGRAVRALVVVATLT